MMTRKITPTLKTLLLVAATLAISLGPAADPADGRDSIRLRVNNAVAEPGGLVAFVIRTDAPQPISQGQISVRAKRTVRNRRQAAQSVSRGASPPLTLESYKVLSQSGDAKVGVQVRTQGGSQIVVLQFSSKSGSINRVDGPLAVLYFRLAATAKPRQEYELSIDAAQTFVVNPKGNPIRFVPRPGVLRVRKPDVDHELQIEGDTVTPGEVAQVELQTFEPVAMSRGHLEIRYDPSITSDLPTVTMNKKSGRRKFAVDLSTPGSIIVDFRSEDASWNLVPGGILTIDLPTSGAVANGTQSPITVDASATELLDSDGVPLPYSFKGGSVHFRGSRDDDSSDDSSDDDSDDDSSDGDSADGSSDGGQLR